MSDLSSGRYPHFNYHWLAVSSPTVFGESCPKLLAGGDVAIAATGVEMTTLIYLDAGTVVTNINFVTGGTAAGTPTAGYAVLRDGTTTGTKIAQTADFGSTARAANTAYPVALATAYTIPADGLYQVGVSFTATTVPTLRGISLGNAALCAVGRASTVTSGSAVGATAPTTLATPSNGSVVPYIYVS